MKIIFASVKYVAVLGAVYLAVMSCFMGRFTFPTQAEYVDRAKPYIPLVQAIYDYQADHGVMPASLQDLVPTYVASLPDPRAVSYNEGVALIVRAHAPHTEIDYFFEPAREGWSSGGDFGKGPMPLPKQASTHPAHAGPVNPPATSPVPD